MTGNKRNAKNIRPGLNSLSCSCRPDLTYFHDIFQPAAWTHSYILKKTNGAMVENWVTLELFTVTVYAERYSGFSPDDLRCIHGLHHSNDYLSKQNSWRLNHDCEREAKTLGVLMPPCTNSQRTNENWTNVQRGKLEFVISEEEFSEGSGEGFGVQARVKTPQQSSKWVQSRLMGLCLV